MDDIIWPPKKHNPHKQHHHIGKQAMAKTEVAAASASTAAEEVIDMREQPPKAPPAPHASSYASKPPKKHWWQLRHQNLSRKQWILISAAIVMGVAAAGVGGYYLYRHLTKVAHSTASIKAKAAAKPTTVPSNLTGLPVDPSLNQRPVTAIMIENSPDARPQSGLNSAGIVYEAIAEGGITRFEALYQAEQPDYIGPIRSVRPYYLDFLMPFNASIAHVGGAPQALSDIKSLGVRDLDQFANGSYYTRITARYAPHNVYTSIAELNKLEANKGYGTSNFTSFPRKKDAPSKQPTARTIDLAISGYLYNVHYDYDAAANAYKRSEGGAPHTDEKSGAQLEPKVVVALVMSRGIDSDGQHTDYTTSGSGAMYVFQDGTVTQGTWHKDDRKSQFSFTDSNGAVLKLNAGQTWISIVDPSTVTYKP